MKKRWIIALFAALAIFAAACSPADESSETTTTADSGDGGGSEGETPYEHLNAALAGEYDGTEITLQTQWTESEEEKLLAVLAPFEESTGITVNHEGLAGDHETVLTVRVEGDDAPDVAQIAQPGKMQQFASEGKLVDLSEWMNMDQLESDYIDSFLNLASYEDGTYGVWFKGDLKSIVWYPVQKFEEAGYQVPETWDELIALSDQIVADGNGNPWCLSVESGDATGWPATDWLEDIVLRTLGGDVYDQWTNHEIAFNDGQILEAADYMSEIYFTPDYAWGGNTGINATWIGDIPTFMITDTGETECWMHKQAAWIRDFFTEGVEFPEDVDFFYFPPIDEAHGTPVLGSGDMMMMFNDRPEVRALMEYFATAEAAKPWIDAGGFISPNQSVPLDWYSDYPNNKLAAIMNGASTFRFDASDAMPAEVGQGTFWSEMVNWIAANGENTDEVFQSIEDSWPQG